MSATGRAAQAGTTLIETLAALAITSLVALVAFPRLQQSLLVLSQHQTVSVVAARLRLARAQAISGDREVLFAVSSDHRVYGTRGALSRAPAGIELRSGAERPVAFYGDGSSSGGSVWVTAARRSVPITVAPVTGAISVGVR